MSDIIMSTSNLPFRRKYQCCWILMKCEFSRKSQNVALDDTILNYPTRQHSSRMHTTRLPTVHVSVATTRCQYWWRERVGPQVNKFEQVFSNDHQMSLVEGGGWNPCQGDTRVPCRGGGGGVPMHHACENITFPQLRLRAVTIVVSFVSYICVQIWVRLAAKRSAGCALRRESEESHHVQFMEQASKEIHSVLETRTDVTRSPKTGVPVVSQIGLMSFKKLKKNISFQLGVKRKSKIRKRLAWKDSIFDVLVVPSITSS